MKIKPRRHAKGRDKLLLVAMKLFAERGFDGVTVRDIGSEANVSIGLITHHFGSKEGLRDAVDAHFLKQSAAAITDNTERMKGGGTEQISQFHRNWVVQYADEWPSFAAYLRRAVADNSAWGQNLFRQYFDTIKGLFERLDHEGQLDEQIDREWLPLIFMFMLIGPLMLDPHVKAMLGSSTYEPAMWERFQKTVQTIFWEGAGRTKT